MIVQSPRLKKKKDEVHWVQGDAVTFLTVVCRFYTQLELIKPLPPEKYEQTHPAPKP